MTELETAFKDFRDRAEEIYPQLDDEFRDVISFITGDTTYIKYATLDHQTRVEFHTKLGSIFASEYQNVHVVMYALSSAMAELQNIHGVADVSKYLKMGGELGMLLATATNFNIEQLEIESEEWEICI